MQQVKLNLGLENNPLQVSEMFAQFNKVGKVQGFQKKVSIYKGQMERTLIVNLTTNVDVEEWLTKMCDLMTQEAIAYKVNGVGALAYNTQFKERFEFSENYFIN